MRVFGLFLAFLFSSSAFAAIIDASHGKVTELSSPKAGVYRFLVKEKPGGLGQASFYLSPDLSEVFERAKQDVPALKKVIAQIYKKHGCHSNGGNLDEKDVYCGELSGLSSANTVNWAFGRSGWDSAAAVRKSFLTFTLAGSGSFTEAALEVTTSIGVEALGMPQDGQGADFEITIEMSEFKLIKH